MLNPWLGLLILVALQGAWWLLVKVLTPRLDPELSRKLFHSGSGALLLLLPILIRDVTVVIIWGFLSILALVLLMVIPELRQKLAGNMYDVGRVSYGDLYFVIGVVLLYFFAQATYYTYAVPLTMLSFADAVSAVIGKRFGRHKYEAVEGRKSIEGSLAFFAVAFVATLGWTPTLPNANLLNILIIALTLGFLTMLLEAVAWRGLDNLLIPLGGYILLFTFLKMDLPELLINMVLAFGLVAFVLGWHHRTTLNDSALITGALFGYTAWTVAGELFGRHSYDLIGFLWLGIPVLLFVVYNLLFAPKMMEAHHETHNVDAIFSAVFAGGIWLYLAYYFAREDFFFPYAAGFAAVAMNMFMEQRMSASWAARKRVVSVAAASATLMVLAGLWVVSQREEGPVFNLNFAVLLFGAAVLGVAISMIIRLITEGTFNPDYHHRWRWHIRALASLTGSVVAALPLLLVRPPEVL
jgi:phytol kinase